MTLALLVAGLGAALLVAAELGCRRWLRRHSGYHVWPPDTRLEIRLDREAFPGFPRRVRFEINADGERGADVRGDEAGLFRVLVAGGSAAECFAIDQPNSWPGVLERLLNSRQGLETLGARRVHVGSVARSGIACCHMDLVFERALPQYGHLSAIVIMAGAADVTQWLEEGAPQSAGGSPAPPPVSATFASHPEQHFGWNLRRWAAVELVRRLRRKWLRPVEVREAAGGWMRAARRMRAEAKQVRTEVPDPAVLLDRFAYHFARVLERAQARADRVLVVRQPWFERDYSADEVAHLWHGGVGKAWKDTIDVYYSFDVVNRLMSLIDARAAAVADDRGVEQLDLRPVLTPNLENYYDFLHFTPAGAAVVAQAVAAALAPKAERRYGVEPPFTATSVTCISSMPPTR